ncbi:hypothetical protein T492DRAFT_849800, partial [Pavlovales sp. CCMP2436]
MALATFSSLALIALCARCLNGFQAACATLVVLALGLLMASSRLEAMTLLGAYTCIVYANRSAKRQPLAPADVPTTNGSLQYNQDGIERHKLRATQHTRRDATRLGDITVGSAYFWLLLIAILANVFTYIIGWSIAEAKIAGFEMPRWPDLPDGAGLEGAYDGLA